MMDDDDDDGGIAPVRRMTVPRTPAAAAASPVTTVPPPRTPTAAARSSTATPASASLLRSPSSASTTSLASSLVSNVSVGLERLAGGWVGLRCGRVKHGLAARGGVAAAHLPAAAALTATQAPHSATLAVQDNALLIATADLLAIPAHTGQMVWVRATSPQPEQPTWFALARLWAVDRASVKTGPRILLSSHASSSIADGDTVQVHTIVHAIHTARTVALRQSPSSQHDALPALELDGGTMHRAMNSAVTAVLINRHVYLGMEVCVSLFGEDHAFQVCAIDSGDEAVAQPSPSQPTDLAANLANLSINSAVRPPIASTAAQSPDLDCPRVSLVNAKTTRIRLVAHVDTPDDASSLLTTAAPAAPPTIDYDAIGGLATEIATLRDLITLPLLQPHLFSSFGLKPPKGVLLYGPPGTGKTMIARAVAQQAFASFYVINGPEIISKHVGESEEKLVALFATARANAPSIIFLDEIDSLCPKRDESTDEMQKRIVAALLTLMDGLSTADGDAASSVGDRVIVIGATNRPDALDSAMRRAGRFDREIEIGIPNEAKRRDILQRMMKNMPHTLTDKELTYVASVTHGYVGADLKALCRESALVSLDRWQRDQPALLAALGDASSTSPSSLFLTYDDFLAALPGVKPSAMRSLIIDVPKVAWTDIGGQDDVKQKLKEAVEWPLMHPEAFLRLGIQPPKGILLYGPPGCSKTLMAKALANESSRNFIAVKGPELFSKYVGESEKAIKEIFRKARSAAPSIIFFDEIDSIAAKRSEGGGGGEGGERVAHRVLSQLLSELDGIEPLKQVTIIAATNRPDMIDAALLRPGRIDRILYVSPPDEASCLAILEIEFRRIGAAVTNVDASVIAPHCVGMSGAELSALCREAALIAMEQDLHAQRLTNDHFLAAVKRITPRITPEMLKFYADYRARSTVASV